MACAKNYIVTWGEGNIRAYNTSFQFAGSFGNSIEIQIEAGAGWEDTRKVESFRVQNGGALFIASDEEGVNLYEIIMPYKTAAPFDFGNIRFIV